MQADIIIIGNEILNGKIQDKNIQVIARSLLKKGIQIRSVQIIQDGTPQFNDLMDQSLLLCDYVFISGGLGPTKDDLTKSNIADYFDQKIVFNQQALDQAKVHYDRGQREYDEELTTYHLLPKDFTALANPIGYAPGIHYKIHRHRKDINIFAMPGVPSELSAMLEDIIIPEYLDSTSIQIKNITLKTWKLPESKIFTTLYPHLWEQLEAIGKVSSLPQLFGVDIGIQIQAKNQSELLKLETSVFDIINKTSLPEHIWHTGNQSLEEVIIQEAREKKLKIGFAESCTGGLCASRITDYSGSSSVFWGSIVSYANSVKENSLQVQKTTLDKYGAVSLETAKEMAIGARKNLGIDIAVTTTGIAGPGGGSNEKPVGTVAIGYSTETNSTSEIFNFTGNREVLKEKFSEMALIKLLEAIRSFQSLAFE